MTPWEPSKIPFLVGFAGILTARYKDLAETYWGIPRARDIVPLLVMAMHAVRSLLRAERLWPDADLQRRLHDALSRRRATLAAIAAVRRFGAARDQHSGRRRVAARHTGKSAAAADDRAADSGALPSRIQQRFHLWLDGFDPPSPEVSWWKKDYQEALNKDPQTEGTGRTESGDAEDCQRRHLVRQTRISTGAGAFLASLPARTPDAVSVWVFRK